MAKMITLTLLPTLALLIMSVLDVKTTAKENAANEAIREAITLSMEVGLSIHYLQRERGYTAMYTSFQDSSTEILMRESFKQTDEALNQLNLWPGESSTPMPQYPTWEMFYEGLKNHRNALVYDQLVNHTLHSEMDYYISMIEVLIDWMYRAIQFADDGDDWRHLVAYQLLLSSKNDIGIERTLGSVYYLVGFFAQEDYLWYLEKKSMGQGNLRASRLFSPTVHKAMISRLDQLEHWEMSDIDAMRSEISANRSIVPSFDKSKWWFDNMTRYLDTMFDVQEELAKEILNNVSLALERDTQEIAISIALFILILCICPIILISVKTMVSDIQAYAATLADQTKELKRERRRAELLLYQMLPESVVLQLKVNKNVSAESYEEASIFFSDIVGFTKIAAACCPLEVVSLLNTLYSCFDARLELYDVYKVETIGDAYMVSSGVPHRNGRRHVTEIATMALDLAHHVTHLEIPHLPGKVLHLRAGVNTGPVVSGVVGSKMPRYCLFGDTVNTASRMESTGEADKIQLSRTTYHAIMSINDTDFMMEPRGVIEIKGKGQMDTYWLMDKVGFEKSLPCMPNCRKFNEITFRRISKESSGNGKAVIENGENSNAVHVHVPSEITEA